MTPRQEFQRRALSPQRHVCGSNWRTVASARRIAASVRNDSWTATSFLVYPCRADRVCCDAFRLGCDGPRLFGRVAGVDCHGTGSLCDKEGPSGLESVHCPDVEAVGGESRASPGAADVPCRAGDAPSRADGASRGRARDGDRAPGGVSGGLHGRRRPSGARQAGRASPSDLEADPELDQRRSLSRMVARVVEGRAPDEAFGARSVTREILQRWGAKMRRKPDSRSVAAALRRRAPVRSSPPSPRGAGAPRGAVQKDTPGARSSR